MTAYSDADVRCHELLNEICREYSGGVREMISMASSGLDAKARRLRAEYDDAKDARHQADLAIVREVKRAKLVDYFAKVEQATPERMAEDVMRMMEGGR